MGPRFGFCWMVPVPVVPVPPAVALPPDPAPPVERRVAVRRRVGAFGEVCVGEGGGDVLLDGVAPAVASGAVSPADTDADAEGDAETDGEGFTGVCPSSPPAEQPAAPRTALSTAAAAGIALRLFRELIVRLSMGVGTSLRRPTSAYLSGDPVSGPPPLHLCATGPDAPSRSPSTPTYVSGSPRPRIEAGSAAHLLLVAVRRRGDARPPAGRPFQRACVELSVKNTSQEPARATRVLPQVTSSCSGSRPARRPDHSP